MVTLDITYKMIEDRPLPMSWEEYEKKLIQEWESLLNSNCSEKDIQVFLEKHPCLLPGAFNMKGKSGHYPFPNALISQPCLSGIGERIPDFMWLSTNSMEFELVLIEIERPEKKWFTSSGVQTSEFTQAHHQLAQWKSWFDEPVNIQVFYENYDIPQYLRDRKFKVSCVLIYGRRNEFEKNKRMSKLRAELAREGEFLMSYDRLAPSADARYLFTVKRTVEGYIAVSYPPTYVLGPDFAYNYSMINNKEDAIDKCEWMSSERKEFIKSRFPYWEKWASKEDQGTIQGGDFE